MAYKSIHHKGCVCVHARVCMYELMCVKRRFSVLKSFKCKGKEP